MQSGGGRSHRTSLAGVDRLITLGIVRVRRPVDVGRQRHLSVRSEKGLKIGIEAEIE